MKSLLRALFFFCFGMTASIHADARDARWPEVDRALNSGLPKTAIQQLEAIANDALRDQRYPEAVRALAQKIALGDDVEGGNADVKIRALQTEIEKSPAAMRPVMEAILAHWYWDYFQRHRWQFAQRSLTAGAPSADFQTWDLATILTEIDRHFAAALADPTALQRMPIGDYEALLNKGVAPDSYRPTLYDFLAYEALQFYQTGEQGAVEGEDTFQIDDQSPIFDDPDTFVAWQPATGDSASSKLKAIRLYQALLRFHERDADRSAYYDADLARLGYGHNVAQGEDANARYVRALTRFVDRTRHHEIPARALAALAQQFLSDGDPAKAHEVARRGAEKYAPSVGAAECQNLLQQIESPTATVTTESVWNAPWPTIDVSYRNVTRIYFRAVPAKFEDTLERYWRYRDDELLDRVLASKPALAWEAALPATPDFKQRLERLPAPTALQPGLYYVVASHDPSFSTAQNQLSFLTVWVSNLALVMQQTAGGSEHAGLVLNAITGEPVAGARVAFWVGRNGSQLAPGPGTITDADGRFAFSSENETVVVLAEKGPHAVSTTHPFYSGRWGRTDPNLSRTFFFTDRAIYRPGQTIHYKGVCIHANQTKGKYRADAQRSVTVVLKDPNGQEIARAERTTNDYGSFAGEFTAPRGSLTGMMTLQSSSPEGVTSVRVEEYKRPKFLVQLEAPKEAAKLDAPVVVSGHAMAYTGAAIGLAKVKWRVERVVQFPRWCWWAPPPASKAIAHGVASTSADGTFTVEFPAVPDRAASPKLEPKFSYAVHVDVTDSTGETRSTSRTIMAGYTALEATIDADEWQTIERPIALKIGTHSLDGDAQSAKGVVKIYTLQKPAAVMRAALTGRNRVWWNFVEEPAVDPALPDSWELAELVHTLPFTTDASGKAEVNARLASGIFRVIVETRDRFGKEVTARQTVQVLDPGAKNYTLPLPNQVSAPSWTVEPGQTFRTLWGTGYKAGRAWIELERGGETLQRFWTSADRTQQLVSLPIDESMRGGVTLRITFVRENRAYVTERMIDVPWTNQQLNVRWETFRSKLDPGKKETWRAIVTSPEGKPAHAEMVAALYDASLDQFLAMEWPASFAIFRHEENRKHSEFQNVSSPFTIHHSWPAPSQPVPVWHYRAFPPEIVSLGDPEVVVLSAFAVSDAGGARGYRASATVAGSRMKTALNDMGATVLGPAQDVAASSTLDPSRVEPKPPAEASLQSVAPRRNLAETAFFFPHLLTGSRGEVKIEFEVPEALTEWRFLGFAHDKDLRAGLLSGKAVTSKPLMVEPNPPRFLREGDVVEFTVKVTNQSDQSQSGTVRLTLVDAASQEPMDAALGNRATDQRFDLPSRQSRSFSWRIAIPDAARVLTYRAVASSAQFSDGEEGFVPVLSRRILVTESLPLPIREKGTKSFEFKKLLESAGSSSLQHQSLTVQMVSQPAWYAVMALPYLMEFPHECSEQIFNRFYANALARHIANSDPKIRQVFAQWKNTAALDSPLTKNQELKSVLLEETPWLRAAHTETQNRHNVGLLFEDARLDEESASALRTLAERQGPDGLWSWFPGGRSSEYISLYITAGFGRLRHLGANPDVTPAIKSLDGLDAWMTRRHREILRTEKPDDYGPSHLDALYLYMRSFFLKDRPISAENRAAIDFFRQRVAAKWLTLGSRQSQAQAAVALQRFGDDATAQAIMRSLKERSQTSEEMGMYWADSPRSWWWYDAPIETQAMLIEAFSEVTKDAQAVEDCKVWLLKQKQTQDWRTTKATADAVYALLLTGKNLLGSDALVEVSLAGKTVHPEHVEAGTGFYEKRFSGAEITPAMGQITVTKSDAGVSWGSVHWQYLEDMTQVTPHAGTPLQLKKQLFVKETTARGQVLKPVTGALAVGDELVVRIELKTDRDMEFVHLKDQRGSGVEPVDVLSRYEFRDGLGFYQSTRDTATHFFIDYLPKGTYVFEYSTRVQLKGAYQSGIAEIQCMYAPEFNSHSESYRIDVR